MGWFATEEEREKYIQKLIKERKKALPSSAQKSIEANYDPVVALKKLEENVREWVRKQEEKDEKWEREVQEGSEEVSEMDEEIVKGIFEFVGEGDECFFKDEHGIAEVKITREKERYARPGKKPGVRWITMIMIMCPSCKRYERYRFRGVN